MKKTYFAPEIEVLTIQSEDSMLAGSMDLYSETVEESDALSRGGGFWDDDEDF